MKKLMLLLLLVGLLAGCATPYQITLQDGTVITAREKPDLDDDAGFYEVELLNGDEIEINKDEIKSMERM